MKLYYVTTNEAKFKSALAALKGSGIELIQEKMETPELQSLNGEEIVIASAKYAAEKKITKFVFDRGGNTYHGRVSAVAKGARKAGIYF